MRVLVFGDSIAYGAFDSQGGWVERLRLKFLEDQSQRPSESVPGIYNLGISGEITVNVIKRLPHEVVARRDFWELETEFILVFAVGINDSQTMDDETEFSDPPQYARDLENLYETAKLFSHRILFVGLTPVDDDHEYNRNYRTSRVWEFEQVLRRFIADHSLPFVPVFELFKDRMHEEELFQDGLHPSDEGHRLLFEAVEPELTKLVSAHSILGQ